MGDTFNLNGFMQKVYSLLGVHGADAPHENDVPTAGEEQWKAQLLDTLMEATQMDRQVYKSWFPESGTPRQPERRDLC